MELSLDGFADVSQMLRCGVYALAKDGVVVYVGKSKTMLSRVAAHRSQWGKKSFRETLPRGILFDQIFIRPCHPDKVDALEAEMINRYKPRLNVALKKPGPITGEFLLHIDGMVLTVNRPQPKMERRI